MRGDRESIAHAKTTIRRSGNVFMMTIPSKLMGLTDLQKIVGKKGYIEWVREGSEKRLEFMVPVDEKGIIIDITLKDSRFLQVKRVRQQ